MKFTYAGAGIPRFFPPVSKNGNFRSSINGGFKGWGNQLDMVSDCHV